MLTPLRRRDATERRVRRGAYLLPSLFTLGNMFCGYCCMVFAIRGDFSAAALCIGAAIVLDGLERFSAPVLEEIESLAQLRLLSKPVVFLLGLTRNEELVADLLPRFEGGPGARAAHQRLAGFTLDETRAYIRNSLRGAGCDRAEELMSDDAVVDVQAFTQGVIGDINALCRAALNAVAERSNAGNRQTRVTRALLKEVGMALSMRYDASAWVQPTQEALAPAAVHLSDPGALQTEAPRLIVSSGKAVVAEIALSRPRMVLGRDKSCDISLNSQYVSRFQNLFMQTPEGWRLIDLSSTNGCLVNGRRFREHRLQDGDLITVGQHQMRFAGQSGTRRANEQSVADAENHPLSDSMTRVAGLMPT